jgi:hypothetical protein
MRSSRDSDDVNRQWQRSNRSNETSQSNQQAINQMADKIERMRRRILGGISQPIKERWQSPKELDPTVAVKKGIWVYISPNNDIVITGLNDLVAGTNKKAYPGIWEAAKDVPATDGTSYNVPQIDYPGATGTPSGTPLKGDLDGDDVYWILICPTCSL